MVHSYDQLEDRHVDGAINIFLLLLYIYDIKQILDSMLPRICSVIDHGRRQNMVRTSVTHLAIALCATFLFLPHFDVICDLLLNRRTATWNLFVNLTSKVHCWLQSDALICGTVLNTAVTTILIFAIVVFKTVYISVYSEQQLLTNKNLINL